ncbi:MAG TPA: hypothetical protein VLI04_04725 [Nocardioidaceae bacterium]|nr:hypothetical protein [Nocardioidaceae bacterium]
MNIPAGTTAQEAAGSLELQKISRSAIELGALGSVEDIKGVTLEPIFFGQQITIDLFGCTEAKWARGECGGGYNNR